MYVQAECVCLLKGLRDGAASRNAQLVAYSGLAVGADQVFAEAALGLGIPLIGVVPFRDYPDDFEGEDRVRYETLLSYCRHVQRMARKRRSPRGYLEAGTWLVRHVDHLVAVWNGRPARGVGGTGDVVRYAKKRGLPILRIDPTRWRHLRRR